MIYHSDDEGYDEIYADWVREGRPRKLLVNGEGYLSFRDNGEVFFVYVDPNDSKYLDRKDPKRRWNQIYGYRSDT